MYKNVYTIDVKYNILLQSLILTAPSSCVIVAPGQARQTFDKGLGSYLPTGHLLHGAKPSLEKDPGPHGPA